MKYIDTKFNTPACEVLFSNLQTPSKFDENKYTIRCVVDAKFAEVVDKPCKSAWDAFCKESGKKMPYVSPLKPLKTQEGEEVAGKLVLKASRSVKRTLADGSAIENKVRMYDAGGQPISVEPFRGSEVVLSVLPFAYSRNGNSGVSLRLIAAQVLKLAEKTNSTTREFSAEDFGFTAAAERTGERSTMC